ncbi:MAG: endonuclease V [Methanomassiliicoccales archaeon]|jgi:deoxyribonuclease V|nr:endonuclease V [Methanomassiliicoccales archaeon]
MPEDMEIESLLPCGSINDLIYGMLRQIPKGMVTTYGDIAEALGDIRAARAIGEIVSGNPMPIVTPCHRVVYSNGDIGWYGGKNKGKEEKKELLRSEGVEIVGDRVANFEQIRFSDFNVVPVLSILKKEQERMRSKVVDFDDFRSVRFVAGVDVSYHNDRAFAAIAVSDFETGNIVEERVIQKCADFPYIPTYLAFREIPVISDLIDRKNDTIYMIDGHGILHPRGFGIASQIGVQFDIPTIGVAKKLLVGEVKNSDAMISPITVDGEVKGYLIKKSVKKSLFVSVGHRISLKTACRICRRFIDCGIQDPLSRAHELANRHRKKSMKEEKDSV